MSPRWRGVCRHDFEQKIFPRRLRSLPPCGGGLGRGVQVPHSSVAHSQRSQAKTLRRRMTDAERKMWHATKAHRLAGVQFRRQVPLGPYIVDFVSHSARIVVEIDGGQHFSDQGRARDKLRDEWLISQGYRVLRFSNIEVLKNIDGVLKKLTDVVSDSTPLPALPHKGGGMNSSERLK